MTSIPRPGQSPPLPLMMWPRTQVVVGTLAVACGAFLGWSGISPVDGAMMLIAGSFLAGIGGYRILRRRI